MHNYLFHEPTMIFQIPLFNITRNALKCRKTYNFLNFLEQNFFSFVNIDFHFLYIAKRFFLLLLEKTSCFGSFCRYFL